MTNPAIRSQPNGDVDIAVPDDEEQASPSGQSEPEPSVDPANLDHPEELMGEQTPAPHPPQRNAQHVLSRIDLRDRACRLLLEMGTAQVTLVTLGDRLGESPRVLVHHFGSRDGLTGAALEQARAQILDDFRSHLARHPVGDLRSLVVVLADLVQAPARRPYFLLFGEVGALATQAPHQHPGFARATVHDWLPHLEAAVIAGGQDPTHVQAQATLALAIVRGLLLDQKATGEVTRAQRLGSRGPVEVDRPTGNTGRLS